MESPPKSQTLDIGTSSLAGTAGVWPQRDQDERAVRGRTSFPGPAWTRVQRRRFLVTRCRVTTWRVLLVVIVFVCAVAVVRVDMVPAETD